MVSQFDWNIIEYTQYWNNQRLARTREYVGVLYFLLALEMLQVALLCGAIQAYALPLRRFYRINFNLVSNKVSTAVHTVVVVALYFIIVATAGASGYIAMSCIIGVWMFFLLVSIAVRKCLQVAHCDDDSVATHSHRRPSADIHGSASFDVGDSHSFDQASQDSGSFGGGPGGLKARLRKITQQYGSWAACPQPMPAGQLAYTMLMLFGAVAVACIFIGVFFGWTVPVYLLVQDDRPVVEYQPPLTAKSVQMLYAFPRLATQFQTQLYVKLFSQQCGVKYSVPLTSDADKTAKIYDTWIVPYNINMSQYIPSDYLQYQSVDEWFVRAIDVSLRPLPTSDTAVVSPADCRLLVFDQATDMLFYLKGYTLTIDTMLNFFVIDGYPSYFENAAVVVARLAPQDYHRFHSPVSGTVVRVEKIPGTYWSVNADAVRSGNNAFLNTRTVIVIDAGPRIGFVAYVAIGATCVGSVRLDLGVNITAGSYINRGEPLGSMHFGGSTVLVLFSRGRILFDPVMLQRSRYGVETEVLVNSEIGASR